MSYRKTIHPTRLSPDPSIWWNTSAEDIRAAEANYKMGFPLVTVRLCQGAIEKALKGYCATIGILDDDLGVHKLGQLAKACGLYAKMPKGWQGALAEYADLHEAGNYPYDELEYKALNDPNYAKQVLTVSQRIVRWVYEEDGAYRRKDTGNKEGA